MPIQNLHREDTHTEYTSPGSLGRRREGRSVPEVMIAQGASCRVAVRLEHRTRELLVRQRIMLVNAIRAHMTELGVVARVGLPQVKELLAVTADPSNDRIPPLARTCLEGLAR